MIAGKLTAKGQTTVPLAVRRALGLREGDSLASVAAAKARGKVLGRKPGQRPKVDRYATRVMALADQGLSYRLIARDLGLSKNTVMAIVHRRRAAGVPPLSF